MKKHQFHNFQEAISNFLEPVTPLDNYARRIVLITGARRFLARVVQTQLKRLSCAAIEIRRGVDEKDRTRDRTAVRLDASGSPSLSLSVAALLLLSRRTQEWSCVDQRPARETSETARTRVRALLMPAHSYVLAGNCNYPPVRSRSIRGG